MNRAHRLRWLLPLIVALGCSAESAAPQAGRQRAQSATSHPAANPTESGPPEGRGGEDQQPRRVELAILDLDGLERLIASHRGKVVVVDAWSTSCEPCLREFPNLVAMSREIGPDKLAAISLALDYDGLGRPEEKREKVLGYLERFGATFDNVLSSDEADQVYQRLEFYAPPAVFVYDRQGKLSQKFDASAPGGHFTYADVRRQVEKLLAAP
jgi:thiol-disulfide isomerase/thioredoxin